MANVYVYSGAAGAGTGADWANAYTTLAAALTAKAAGDDFWVADDHAESTAGAVTLTSPGTAASPCRILCVLRSGGSVPPVAADLRTTATVSTTGANAITFVGHAYYYGITFTAGSAASNASINLSNGSAVYTVFDSCRLKLGNTSANARIATGGAAASGGAQEGAELVNTVCEFGSTSQGITVNGPFTWGNTASAIAGSVPTTLFITATVRREGHILVQGVDLSAAGAGKTLVDVSGAARHEIRFENCKLGSSVTITTGTHPGPGGPRVWLINCDSADTNYRYQYTDYRGTITQESTIVRSGGASDGTTAISRKMVSGANSKIYSPLFFDILFWNESLSALSLACEVVSDGVTFTDAELWMEVEYLGNGSFPLSSIGSDRASTILTTPANQSSSSVTWTTTGLSSPTKQKLEVSVTAADKGWIRCRIYLAKASSTVYVCPLITGLGFTSGRQWQGLAAYILEGAGGSSGGVTVPQHYVGLESVMAL